MSIAFALWSVPAATALAYGAHFAKVGLFGQSFDNTRPRELNYGAIEKPRADVAERLHAAHLNMLETLGVYAGGVAAAVATRAPVERVTAATACYLGFRVLYLAAYAAPQVRGGMVRTLVFVLSVTSMMWLWAEAAVAGAQGRYL